VAYEDIVTWVGTQLEAVDDIGQVHTTEPRAETLTDAVTKFAKTGTRGDVLCTWFIGHGAFDEHWKTSSHGFADEGVVITGIYSRSGDTSEKTQRQLIEAIRDKIRVGVKADHTLGGLVHRANFLKGGRQVPVDFFGVLCFRVELDFTWNRQMSG